MPEPLIHLVIPFASLTIAGVGRRKALLISLLALTPDLDILFLTHRTPSHSLIPLLAIAFTLYVLLRRKKYRTYVLLGALSVMSHLALDMFTWYTPVIWPIWDQSLQILVDLKVNIASEPLLVFNSQILPRPTIFETFETIEGQLITSEGLIISTILLLPTLIKTLQEKLSLNKSALPA